MQHTSSLGTLSNLELVPIYVLCGCRGRSEQSKQCWLTAMLPPPSAPKGLAACFGTRGHFPALSPHSSTKTPSNSSCPKQLLPKRPWSHALWRAVGLQRGQELLSLPADPAGLGCPVQAKGETLEQIGVQMTAKNYTVNSLPGISCICTSARMKPHG